MSKGRLHAFYWLTTRFLFLFLIAAGCSRVTQQEDTQLLIPSPAVQDNFKAASPDVKLVFPEDHGAHPDYQTEWWYYTGNLVSKDGREFGYQLTFFRRAILPEDLRPTRSSQWAAEQVYLAHFAITDVRDGSFYYFDRLGRGAAGLAGASADPEFRVWLEDWSVEEIGADTYRLQASEGDIRLDLTLKDSKGPVLQGEDGYSQKGPEEGNASMYYSLSRLDSSGNVTIGAEQFQVDGSSWMDHEFSTSALSQDQVGWDWFALQLDNGYELMVYTIRNNEGEIDPYSRGIWIDPQGNSRALNAGDFKIQVNETWESAQSGAVYPSNWRIDVPSEGLSLNIKPLLDDQELNLNFIYWEGAVDVAGEYKGVPVGGKGYVELTGYAQSMQGQF